ncbi:MAG TPA: ferritin family protein [Syntrophales bacterium]|nr:ferritin family protein [Syntrophales bacterium]HPQ44564.1 ferritin family protein [Syntrophales bacterium]
MNISKELRETLLAHQKNEITEHYIYARLAKKVQNPENRRILEKIADDELRHYHVWQHIPDRMWHRIDGKYVNTSGSAGYSVSPSGSS